MNDKLQKIKQDIIGTFYSNYYKQANIGANRDKFAKDLNEFLQRVQQDGLLQQYKLEPVKVTGMGDNVIVDIFHVFKNFPKHIQEDICCQMVDIDIEDVEKFVYNDEGYIDNIVLKSSKTEFILNDN